MKLGWDTLIPAACIFAVILSGLPAAAQDAPQWHTGVLKSADMSGHGPITGKRIDIWWVYCISTGEKDYSVVSRMSPPRAGLTVGSPVRFFIDGGQMTISNPRGEHREFRIMRQGKGNMCR
jgi:hypothetical protein